MAPPQGPRRLRAAYGLVRSRYRRLTFWNKLNAWGAVAGIASLALAVFSIGLSIVLYQIAQHPERPRAKNPLTVELEWNGSAAYSDIQTSLGCIGTVNALDVAARPQRLTLDEAQNAVAFGSSLVQFSLLPDLPTGEYISVRELTVRLTSYEPPTRVPALLTDPGPCVSLGPDYSNLDFRAVLTPHTRIIELFRGGPDATQLGALAVKAGEPVSIAVDVMARDYGWYRGEISIAYWYRGDERTEPAEDFAFYLPPSGAFTDVYALNYGPEVDDTYLLLGERTADGFVDSLGPDGGGEYPPTPVDPAVRSGFVGYREITSS